MKAVNFKREEGTFWIPWQCFLEWFDEFTVCKLGVPVELSKISDNVDVLKHTVFGMHTSS